MKKFLILNLFRTVAIVVVLIGVVGSISLVLYKGRNNESVLLIALFIAWVLSPFIAFLISEKVSKRWTDFSRKTLYALMLIITTLSLLSYFGVFSPAGTKTAFVFLVVPLISWVLIVILLLIVRSQSK